MRIHSIFKSINGEVNKYHQGSICIFIRLAGCSLRCKYCDTVQAQSPDSGKEMNIDEIINEVVKFKNCYRVTITGGEPLLQEAELEELVNRLSMEYDISIETNGAHQIKKVWPVSWVVDYKCSSSGMKKKMLLKNYQLVGTHDIISCNSKSTRL